MVGKQASITTHRRPLVREKHKYEQVRGRLMSEIAVGNLRPGDALPSEQQLAEMLQVSRTTIRQTLGDMERDGFIRRVHGKGTFVAEKEASQPASQTTSFAIIVPDVASHYYTSLLAAFEQAAHDAGRSVVVCGSNNDVDKQASQIVRLIDQDVAGVVLNPSAAPTPACQVRLIQKAGIPVVLLHRPVEGVAAPLVRLCSEEIGRRAGRLLAEAGHRRVAFVAASQRTSAAVQQEGGLRLGLAEWSAELPDERIEYGQMISFSRAEYSQRERFIEGALQRLLSLPEKPTALYVTFDSVAELTYLVAQRMGLRVPGDLSILCFGSAHRAGAIMPRLTAITVDEATAAQQAVKLLVDLRDSQREIQDDQQFILPLSLSKGETLGPPPNDRTEPDS